MDIYCELSVKTSIDYANLCIINQDDYFEYLDKLVATKDIPKMLAFYHFDDFGDVKFEFFVHKSHLFSYRGKASIYVTGTIEYNDEDKLIERLETDTQFLNFIEDNLKKYIPMVNEALESILFPKNYDFTYSDDKLFIEISPYERLVDVEWISLQLNTFIEEIEIYSKNSL